MMSSRKILTGMVLLMSFLSLGCSSIWHNLQPHRIQRLNRGPAPSMDPEFSRKSPKTKNQLASNQRSSGEPKAFANSAEIAGVRAQSE